MHGFNYARDKLWQYMLRRYVEHRERKKETTCRPLRDRAMYGVKRRRQLSIAFTCVPDRPTPRRTVACRAVFRQLETTRSSTCRCIANPTTPAINEITNALHESRVLVHCCLDSRFACRTRVSTFVRFTLLLTLYPTVSSFDEFINLYGLIVSRDKLLPRVRRKRSFSRNDNA